MMQPIMDTADIPHTHVAAARTLARCDMMIETLHRNTARLVQGMGEQPSPFHDAQASPAWSQDAHTQMITTLRRNAPMLSRKMGEHIPPSFPFDAIFGSQNAHIDDIAAVWQSMDRPFQGERARSAVGLPPPLLLPASAAVSTPSVPVTAPQNSSQRPPVVVPLLPTTPRPTAPSSFPRSVSGQEWSSQGAPGAFLVPDVCRAPLAARSAPARPFPGTGEENPKDDITPEHHGSASAPSTVPLLPPL